MMQSQPEGTPPGKHVTAPQATTKLRLSPEQVRLWFLDKLSQNAQGFVLHASFELRGQTDAEALSRAVDAVVDKHVILSAQLIEEDNTPWLTLGPTPPALERCSADTPRRLPTGRLFRVMLQPLGGHHQLTFLIHHIIADRASMAIVINDCFAVLRSQAIGTAPQFADRLREPAPAAADAQALADWCKALEDAPAEISLPLDHPRPVERGTRGAMISQPLPAPADLTQVARSMGVTPFMVYLATYAELLQRWGGDSDMVIGCPVSTRQTSQEQDMVGFMVRTLPLRLQFEPDDTLPARVNAIKHTLLTALARPPVSLDQIVSALNPRRHLNRNPLFQAMFVLQAQALDIPQLPGIDIAVLPSTPLAPEVDLNLSIERTTDPAFPYVAHLEYDPDLFEPETIAEFLRQYVDLCCQTAGSPRSEPARAAHWKGTFTALPNQSIDALIHQNLQAQAPDRCMIEDTSARLSTAETLARTHQIVQALSARGLGYRSGIGLCVSRLTELVPALLAIWRIGAHAVFLPTTGPVEAIAERVRSISIDLILTGTDSLDLAAISTDNLPCVSITSIQPAAPAGQPAPKAPLASNALDQTAYVCFTSGSTGQPKPVFITHESLLNHALDIRQRFGLHPADRVLQFAAPSFDVLIEEVVPSLLAGATLVQLGPAHTRDLEAFTQALQAQAISVANLPAAYWHTWVHELLAGGGHVPSTLRLLVTGSEAVQAEAARTWLARAPHCALLCGYGLTETTVSASFFEVTRVPAEWSTLPLGVPINNVEIDIVGPDDLPVPPLCLGEIRIRGKALMRHPDAEGNLTALGALRTGDLGRMSLDGHLWCLGRCDRQVKIRGIRVAPATLENALLHIDGITEAAALVHRTGQRNGLYAFVCGRPAVGLKDLLKNRLPDVLIPDQIITLPTLPLTVQGKTDYRALAAQVAQASDAHGSGTLDSHEERLLARLFGEVLQRTAIGPDDNFFDLGGDSISSLQVISRARRAGLDLSAKTIFEHQTVRAIARHAIAQARVVENDDATGLVWSTPILAWFKGEMSGDWQQFNQAVVIALPEPVDLEALHAAFEAVVECHEIFGLQVTGTPGPTAQYTTPERRPAPGFEVLTRPANMADDDWAEQRRQALNRAQTGLNPALGLNVAAVVFPTDQQLMLTVHHLCIDVLSWQVVLRDLQNAYESLAQGYPATLRRHGVPYRRWATTLAAYSQRPDVQSALPFWVNVLSPAPDRLAPALPAHPGIEAEARSHLHELPLTLTQHLLRKVPATLGLRMDETLLAALAMAHASHDGRLLRVDLERNGRGMPIDDLDITETVGWFTSVIPLALPAQTDPATMAQQVKSALAQCPHDGLSYGLLRYGDNPAATAALAALPPADVLVNYVGVLDGWTQAAFQPVDADTGPTIAANLARSHRIELNAGVVAGRLRLAVNYAAGPESEAAAATLMEALATALARLAQACGYRENTGDNATTDDTAAQLPVTPLQHAILLHSLHDADTYFDQIHFRLTGPLDTATLKKAWAELLARHGALRCGFDFDQDEQPFQCIAASAELPWHDYDWRSIEPAVAQRYLDALMQADRRKGFDLHKPPLMRMHLIQRDEQHYDWIWSCHHLIVDGWSVSILMQEWLTLYRYMSTGQAARLPEAPDWADFVRHWDALDATTARQWWSRQLADATPTLIGRRQTGTNTSVKAQHHSHVTLDPAMRDALGALCRQHGVPLGVLVQAAWAMLLRRYQYSNAVTFGITFAHRPPATPNADALVGMTINTVPVWADMDPDMRLPTLLDALRQQSFDRADHAFIGLEDILQSAGCTTASPLFDTLLLVQNYPRPESLTAGELDVSVSAVLEQTNFAVTAIMTTGDDAGLTLAWDAARLPDRVGRAMLQHWHQLLRGMITQPEARLRELSIYDASALAARLALAQGPETTRPAPMAPQQVDQWADIIPEHPAISAHNGTLSYAALRQATNALCAELLAQGVRPTDAVALHLPRGTRAIVALLAIMKAGAMAVPIDASYPDDRVATILEDSQAKWRITESGLTDRAGFVGRSAQPIIYDSLPNETSRGLDAKAAPALVAPDWPAYLIYTSGSTGKPKGAITRHQGLANMLRVQQHHIGPHPADRVLQFASLAFDASIWEIFMALGAGATLYIPDPDTVGFGEELLDDLARQAITIATLPPSLLIALPSPPLPALTTLIVAGEACPATLIPKWANGRRFFNGYGPSETSVCATLHPVSAASDRVPIGQPVAHMRAYVVDLDGALVPPGGEGELVIGGEGVGPGYLNRPSLTAERFRLDPWQPNGTARIYHSGDKVSIDADGVLAFIGRIDRQVKVRGYRVEPGEIERTIEHLAPIDKALVGVTAAADEAVLCAWLLPAADASVDLATLRQGLAHRLPAHLVPTRFQVIDHIPLTANGKINWSALPAPDAGGDATTTPKVADTHAPATSTPANLVDAVAQTLEPIWTRLLGQARIDRHRNFFDLGGQSLLLVKMQPILRDTFNVNVPTKILFEHATIHGLAKWLAAQPPVIDAHTARPPSGHAGAIQAVPAARPKGVYAVETAATTGEANDFTDNGDIAVIGMACRFPGADSVDAFWQMLHEEREGIHTFDPASLTAAGVPTHVLTHENYVPRRGIINHSDQFDAEFFGIGPRDALLLDPQHRLFLEGVWNAFEDAGEIPGGHVGVFAGCGHNTWLKEVLAPAGENLEGSAGFHAITANDKDFLATQVAYRLDLTGPAVTVQSACSTSLIAVSQAVDALRSGRCDMALAGGVAVSYPEHGYLYESGMILSPDGHCRPFAADAAGTVPGAGMGVVLLKPLSHAKRDGNRIYAVIKGTGVSNDGARKMSFAAPGIDGQVKAIQAALSAAKLNGNDIDLIEAHGTGTALGDPVEITALGRVYGKRNTPLLIGAVKSNIGHADAAAGIAGFIKAALSLHHGFMPASLHAATPNPKLDPGPDRWFEIVTKGRALIAPGRPLRAGISAFGIGGTNAHVIIEQSHEGPPRPAPSEAAWQLVPLSAATSTQLPLVARGLAQRLASLAPDESLSDVATSLQRGRARLKVRKAFVTNACPALRQMLENVDPPPASTRKPSKIALLLPGQGAQHPGMGHALFHQHAGFREHLEDLSDRLRPLLSLSLKDALYSGHLDPEQWQDTRIAQPAIFAVSLACAQWWSSIGVKTDAMLGHSLGEYTAACLAGVFSVDDALETVAERARLMAAMPTGAMLAIALDEPSVKQLLTQHPMLDLAAINGPRQAVVSGPHDVVSAVAGQLSAQGVPVQRLRTSHAFHSRAMTAAAEGLGAFLRTRTLNRPTRKFVSNLTGTWISPEQAVTADYWVQHMLAPVQFMQGLRTLQDKGAALAIEAGPGQVLSLLARGQGLVSLPTLDSASAANTAPSSEAPTYLHSTAQLWETGVDIDWIAFNTSPGRRIALPPYPWAHQTFRPSPVGGHTLSLSATPTSSKPPPDDWFYAPQWVQCPLPAIDNTRAEPLLVYCEFNEPAQAVADVLRSRGHRVTLATTPAARSGIISDDCAHLLVLAPPAPDDSAAHVQQRIGDVLLLVRDTLRHRHPATMHIDLVTYAGATTHTGEIANPTHAALIAAFQVLAHEFPEHHFAGLDLPATPSMSLARDIHAWLLTERAGRFVAQRQGKYWAEQVTRINVPNEGAWPVPPNATLLITGATGGVGQAFAKDMARLIKQPHLLLITRQSNLPQDLRTSLEQLGARVSHLSVDVADEMAFAQALHNWQKHSGPIHGVVHAAGVADYGGVMARRDQASIDTVLSPKIAGLHGIARALAGQPLAFVVLCSTLGSFLPAAKFGQIAYSAANAYLDASANALAARQPWHVVTINWDDWVGAGMTEAARRQAGLPPLPPDHGLLAEEGPAALRRVLQTRLTRVAIAVNDLPALMTQTRTWLRDDLAAPGTALGAQPQQSPVEHAASATPGSSLEQAILQFFREVLNTPDCTAQDNFFDLGGHSLLAMQLISRIRESTGHEVTLMDLFASSSASDLAQVIAARAGKPTVG
ncbi:non-ribosomal peptide synthetase/type I polyketide synthase [Pusillimonas minor]|uniref:Amino acid adenylation domain-containing protein n=1 Tax=Pusillimonas minor TaxID=2697024 RepID=A0A842HKZ9_9BURK|nr:non-ribosomal peptide synthetase/type I polyketide synthase [Pusillimonas minor]MBC2768956.1 amino acid adenylation domain-containing protein [Pusillimonas minor]